LIVVYLGSKPIRTAIGLDALVLDLFEWFWYFIMERHYVLWYR